MNSSINFQGICGWVVALNGNGITPNDVLNNFPFLEAIKIYINTDILK